MKGIVLTVRIALLIMVSILINSKAIQAAELKDEVIKELTSDLTELSKMIQPKVATAKNFPPDQIVVGTVEDLTSDWLTAAKKAGFSENATIATMSKAFKENSFVMTPAVVRGPTKFLKVEGKPDQLPLVATIPLLGWLFKKDQQVAINDRTIAQVAMSDNFEAVINEVLNKINLMVKKYKGKGIVIKGFSLNLGIPPSATLNFEFEGI